MEVDCSPLQSTFDALKSEIENHLARVAVIGLGYVGLPVAVTAAGQGFRVIGLDTDPAKIDMLQRAESYVGAVGSAVLASDEVARRTEWTSDFRRLSEAQVIVICVPTPLRGDREPDLSYVEASARSIAANMLSGTLVILESTTYPGTTDEILVAILNESGLRLGEDFWVGYSPEREDPGSQVFAMRHIPKVVGGVDAGAEELLTAFYGRVVDSVVPVSSAKTAEAVKITENIFRAVNIALVNELKVIYDAMGIDIWEVIDAAATKPFGYMPFYPGPGLGGHCIPIDPFYLSWKAREFDLTAQFIELAGDINVRMPIYVIKRLVEALRAVSGRDLGGASVLIVGLSYKKNVADIRESPAVKLMELVIEAGATVAYHDPHVPVIPHMREYPQFANMRSVPLTDLRCGKYHAVIIATDHDAIDFSRLLSLGIPVIDTRNAFGRRNLGSTMVFKA